MAKLSELIDKIDVEAKEGSRKKALLMIEKLLEKVPDNDALLARKVKYQKEYEYETRLEALEKKYGIS
ncbi:MAG: hypothetical protein JXA64_07480 [Candidatus Fermentibacteraceae bacterium]|nr:hypothetical protein [Candidatus Fermentibacteraceae bacterium]MBN2608942.1 hypothetical protein [Candidatus Fermentibacteraceae bacterium]